MEGRERGPAQPLSRTSARALSSGCCLRGLARPCCDTQACTRYAGVHVSGCLSERLIKVAFGRVQAPPWRGACFHCMLLLKVVPRLCMLWTAYDALGLFFQRDAASPTSGGRATPCATPSQTPLQRMGDFCAFLECIAVRLGKPALVLVLPQGWAAERARPSSSL
mgnify:CR=1 FL=1